MNSKFSWLIFRFSKKDWSNNSVLKNCFYSFRISKPLGVRSVALSSRDGVNVFGFLIFFKNICWGNYFDTKISLNGRNKF